jgi:hypothetical protein
MQSVILPEDYNYSISHENKILEQINNNFTELAESIETLPNVVQTDYIADFESFSMDLYFSENTKKINISIFGDIITLSAGKNKIRVDSDGNVIQ